jgi:murein DD-endopeptidase MepM/ murein hydrolase activator NlpD
MLKTQKHLLVLTYAALIPVLFVLGLVNSGSHIAIARKGALSLPRLEVVASPSGKAAKRSVAPASVAVSAPRGAKPSPAAVARVAASPPHRKPRHHGFIWPVYGHLTSLFGPRVGGFHHGLDIACAAGTPIRASHAGKVTFKQLNNPWYGKVLVIAHKGGYSELYAHLSRTQTGVGRRIKQGQVIGYCGTTGMSTGNHLHFETRKHGRYMNPLRRLT